ncbi:MAG: GxxExxY protein [FCB group bacterium]|nr:GxxExxY protein [FCB group bacterium]
MINEELTEKILSSCFEVINELGAGFLESVYEKALLITLEEKGLKAKSQVKLDVYFHEAIVGEFFADIIVEDKVILELKTVKMLAPEHQAQLINYLKATRYKLGLLINFGKRKIEYKRLYNPDLQNL